MELNSSNGTLLRQTTPPAAGMSSSGVLNFASPLGHQHTPKLMADRGVSQNETPTRRLIDSPRLGLISPNDDEKERARARRARAAQRRRSFGGSQLESQFSDAQPDEEPNILSAESLTSMLQNCLKLSNANKINQGNTWDLKLIDHLSDLVRNDVNEDSQTNFQLASCTLETGVKIYSYRVDSVHSEAYKLLGGLGRSANEQQAEELAAGDEDNAGSRQIPAASNSKKAGSTLLASDESINLKKFDVAFNVDPLFHQMSALFDDGGAQGLLLNNLSVYSGCEIAFDSFEVPETRMRAKAASEDCSEVMDLTFMKDALEEMLETLKEEPELTPTLKEIVKILDDPRRAEYEAELAHASHSSQSPDSTTGSWSPPTAQVEGAQDDDPGAVFDQVDDDQEDDYQQNENFQEGEASPNSGSWGFTAEEQEEDADGGEEDSPGTFMSQDPVDWLPVNTGMLSKSNAWAGPDHWKYAKPKEDTASKSTDTEGLEKTKRKRKEPFAFDFFNPPEIDLSNFDPPSNPRSLLLPQSIAPLKTLLPEDYHFEAASLTKFFLRPSLSVVRRRRKKTSDNFNPSPNNDGNDVFEDWVDDGGGGSDVEDPETVLVPEPRKVQKISINYDKRAKQVDVRLLKRTLWEQVQGEPLQNDQGHDGLESETGISFNSVLQRFPEDCPAAAPEDISVHLCFICLLHLANEHCLRIDDCSTMDDLKIFFSSADTNDNNG